MSAQRSLNVQRGAVLVETALSIVVILTVMYGTLQIGLVGIEQLRADGAAFTASHAQALNVSEPVAGAADPATKASSIYAGVQTTDVSLASGTPPTTAETVNYNFGNTSSRHGGVSMMLPVQIVSTVLRNNVNTIVLGATGSLFTLSGSTVDGAYVEMGAHADIQGDAFNSLNLFNGQANYFTQGENTPPYFVGFHYMTFCESTTSWAACPTQDFDALGMAEYLDVDNWGRAAITGTGGVFTALLGHQQTYAQISVALAAAPTAAQLYANGLLRWNQGVLGCMYNTWDSRQPGGYPLNYTSVGQYPLHPDVICDVGS